MTYKLMPGYIQVEVQDEKNPHLNNDRTGKVVEGIVVMCGQAKTGLNKGDGILFNPVRMILVEEGEGSSSYVILEESVVAVLVYHKDDGIADREVQDLILEVLKDGAYRQIDVVSAVKQRNSDIGVNRIRGWLNVLHGFGKIKAIRGNSKNTIYYSLPS